MVWVILSKRQHLAEIRKPCNISTISAGQHYEFAQLSNYLLSSLQCHFSLLVNKCSQTLVRQLTAFYKLQLLGFTWAKNSGSFLDFYPVGHQFYPVDNLQDGNIGRVSRSQCKSTLVLQFHHVFHTIIHKDENCRKPK